MKVYVVWYDNGEQYEDNFQCIHKIFSTYELAEEYLNIDYEKIEANSWNKEPYWRETPYICSQGKSYGIDCQNCHKWHESESYDGSMFIDQDGDQTNECPEEFYVDGNFYTTLTTYTIQEWDILDSLEELTEEKEEYKNIDNTNLYDSTGVDLNSKRINKNIRYNLLTDKEMIEAGFIKNKDNWYYCKRLKRDSFEDRDASITMNITLPIPVDNDKLDISVLDEAFLQPYDFQTILNKNPKFGYALEIAKLFEEQMKFLNEKGILFGHKKGEYV